MADALLCEIFCNLCSSVQICATKLVITISAVVEGGPVSVFLQPPFAACKNLYQLLLPKNSRHMYHELWNLKFSLFWSFRNTMSEGIVLGKWPLQWSDFCSGYQKYRLSLGIIYLTQKTQRMPSRAGSPPKSTIRGTSSFYLPSVSSSMCSFILYGSCANTFQEGKREWWVTNFCLCLIGQR